MRTRFVLRPFSLDIYGRRVCHHCPARAARLTLAGYNGGASADLLRCADCRRLFLPNPSAPPGAPLAHGAACPAQNAKPNLCAKTGMPIAASEKIDGWCARDGGVHCAGNWRCGAG